MTAFLVRLTLQGLVPLLFAASSFYFFRYLAFYDVIAGIGSLILGLKLSTQGQRNATEYLADYEAGLSQLTPLAFVLKFATPFFGAVAAAFAADALDWHYGFFIPSVTGLVTGGIIFLLAYVAVRIDYGPLRTIFIRGRCILSYRDARRRAGQLGCSEGFQFGGLRIPERLATSHFLAVGTTGSGKTVTIRLLLEGITDCMRRQHDAHAVIYDPKANVLPLLRQMSGSDVPIVDLHPFRNGSSAWNIAADVRTSQDIEAVVNTLIPIDRQSAENPFFANAPRELMQFVMRGLIKVAGADWTLRDVYLIMTTPDYLKATLSVTEEGKTILPQYFENEDPRTMSNIQLSIRTRTLQYRTVAAAAHQAAKAGQLVSLRDWAESGNGFLVLGADKVEDSGIEALNRVAIQLLAKYWLLGPDSPHTPKHFLVLDEVQSAGKISALSKLLNQGREKGVSAVFGFQDVASVKQVYGADATEALLGQFSHKAILRLEGDATSQWASRVVGDVEQFEYTYGESVGSTTAGLNASRSITYSTSEQRVRKAALMPSDFLTIPPTNSQNGLTGYYSSPDVGVWKHTYAARDLWESGRFDTPDDVAEVGDVDFPLEPFDSEDLKRLGLLSNVQAQEEPDDETPPEPESTRPLKRDWVPIDE